MAHEAATVAATAKMKVRIVVSPLKTCRTPSSSGAARSMIVTRGSGINRELRWPVKYDHLPEGAQLADTLGRSVSRDNG
jgi:hypothetical protein